MAEMRLKQRLEMIDWREDVLLPEVEALISNKAVLGLPAGTAFDFVLELPQAKANADTHTAEDNHADHGIDDWY